MLTSLNKQKGTALLMALMLMAIVAIIATALAFRQQLSIKRSEQVFTTQQAYLYAQAVNDWAAAKLIADGKEYMQNTAHGVTLNTPLMDTFPMEFSQTYQGVTVKGKIIDAQSLFNLNTLTSPDSQKAFTQLILLVDSDIDKKQANQITQAIYQWVTPLRIIQQQLAAQNSNTAISTTGQPTTNPASSNNESSTSQTPVISLQSNNANSFTAGGINSQAPSTAVNENNHTYALWDQSYLTQKPPYNVPHLPMASASELRLVHGVSADLYSKLAPFIIALPELASQININTAPAEILAATAQGLSLNAAQLVVDDRQNKTFNSISAYASSSDLANAAIMASLLTVQSQYFLVKADIKMGGQQLTVYTLMLREGVQTGSASSAATTAANTPSNSNTPKGFSPGSLQTVSNNTPTQKKAPAVTIQVLWQSIGTY